MDEKEMTEITLSYLQSLDMNTELTRLKMEEKERYQQIRPLQKILSHLQEKISAIERSKTQAIVKYYIEQAIRKHHKFADINWETSNIPEGIIHCYNDYGHADIDNFKVKLNEQLEIIK